MKILTIDKHAFFRGDKSLVKSVAYKDDYVDAGCFKCIVLLNELGYKTKYSCSGLHKDHVTEKHDIGGYIAFPQYRKVLHNLFSDLGWEIERDWMIYKNPLIVRTGYKKRESQYKTNKMWRDLEGELKRLKNERI